jgi:chemotaxis protein MotB
MFLKRRGKKQQSSDHSLGGGWEVVYTGFILILLCFFIMLCSFSTMQQSKVTRFVKSFNQAVSIFSGGVKLEKGDIMLPDSADMVDEKSNLADIYRDVITRARRLGLEDSVDIAFTDKNLVMRLANAILFDTGSAQIRPVSMPLLLKIGQVIQAGNHLVRIEGHTDDRPIKTRRFPSNWELSTARAVNVLRFLTDRGGVSPKKLSAAGFGEYQPLTDNETAAHRARNRRVEIVFRRETSEAP